MLTREEWLNIDIKELTKVHFIGINSGFNSFCANYLLSKGIEVKASEAEDKGDISQEWIDRGVLYSGFKHSKEYITEDLDLVVFPNAPIPGNVECQRAEELGIPAITVGQMTGLIGKEFKTIAVAGTHGKTTTTSLIIWMLKNAFGKLPNFIVGDTISEIDKYWNFNLNSEYFVVESCEYKRQFLDRAPIPFISVITNIELDHTDYYKNLMDYNSAFSEFISKTTEAVVIDSRLDNSAAVLKKSNLKDGVRVIDIKDIEDKCINIDTPLFGEHNRQNLMRACGVAEVLNIAINLSDFPGVASRFEFKGITEKGMPVYLDYAHNPAKIEACLEGARDQYGDKNILLVWQPHSYERTFSSKEDFAESIYNADEVLIPNIFVHKRERGLYEHLISVEEFAEYLQDENPDMEIQFSDGFDNTIELLEDPKYDDNYICILASAGDLKKILPRLNLEK